jgi:hypothetical protein
MGGPQGIPNAIPQMLPPGLRASDQWEEFVDGVEVSRDGLRIVITARIRGSVFRDSLQTMAEEAQEIAKKARVAPTRNNLKQIMLALHNYHDTHRMFPPPVSIDDNGKPRLSWRVQILPFLEQGELYQKFRQNEPWDSPHTSNTSAVLEVDEDRAVIWSKPEDFAYDPENPASGLGGLLEDEFHAGFADGRVVPIKQSTEASTLKAMFTPNGGEVISH